MPQDTIKQQEWKIDRMAKDNRALEAANLEARQKLDELREENLQVLVLPPLHRLQSLCFCQYQEFKLLVPMLIDCEDDESTLIAQL